MKSKNLSYYALFIAIGLAIVGYGIFELVSQNNLPIYNEEIGEDEDGNIIYHTISDYVGFDQHGNTFTNEALANKVHVANFFFCSCPVVCPQMTEETKKVYDAFGENEEFMIVSYSIDPKRDSIPKLTAFADKLGVNKKNWHFVNIGKESVYKIARYDYDITTVEGTAENNDFIHSELLTLVDRDLKIRGYYDSTEPDEIEQLIKDIKKIL